MAFSEKPLLVVDASTPSVQVGILAGPAWAALHSREGDALELVFELVEACLAETRLRLMDVGGFIFCEGPGSLLGLRISAMAVSTWMQLPELQGAPLWTYRSMAAAVAMLEQQRQPEPFTTVSPFRRGLFNIRQSGSSEDGIVKEEALQTLPGSLHFVPQRHLPAVPEGAEPLTYALRDIAPWLHHTANLQAAERPDVYVPEPLEFQRWSGERHR